MSSCLADDFLSTRRMSHDASKIAHTAGRNEECSIAPEDLRRARLQPIDGRVLQVNVVANVGLGHRFAHGRRRLCYCIATQIDDFVTHIGLLESRMEDRGSKIAILNPRSSILDY